MVCGYTNQTQNSVFAGMQSMDFLYLLSVSAGTMNMRKPTSCLGNNMSYRKDVYLEIGGYESLPFSVTEDFKLLMAFQKLGTYKIIYPLDAEGLVTSKSCEDVKSLYWQKKRWGVGGWEAPPFAFMVMSTGWIAHACIFLSPFFYSANGLYLFFFKILMDFFLLKHLYDTFKLKMNYIHFLVFELYFIFYVLLLPVIVFFSKRVRWKGREFNKNNGTI